VVGEEEGGRRAAEARDGEAWRTMSLTKATVPMHPCQPRSVVSGPLNAVRDKERLSLKGLNSVGTGQVNA
jgi:hypothetical protein